MFGLKQKRALLFGSIALGLCLSGAAGFSVGKSASQRGVGHEIGQLIPFLNELVPNGYKIYEFNEGVNVKGPFLPLLAKRSAKRISYEYCGACVTGSVGDISVILDPAMSDWTYLAPYFNMDQTANTNGEPGLSNGYIPGANEHWQYLNGWGNSSQIQGTVFIADKSGPTPPYGQLVNGDYYTTFSNVNWGGITVTEVFCSYPKSICLLNARLTAAAVSHLAAKFPGNMPVPTA